MNYISTRGGIAPVPFDQAVMMGLARDGGSVKVHPFKSGGVYTPDEFIAELEAALAGQK